MIFIFDAFIKHDNLGSILYGIVLIAYNNNRTSELQMKWYTVVVLGMQI